MRAIYSELERGTERVYITNVVSANETNAFGKDMYFIQEVEGKGFWQEEITMQEAELLLGHKLNKETADGSVGVNSHMCFLSETTITEPKNSSSKQNTFKLAAFFLASQRFAEIEGIIQTSDLDETEQRISEMLNATGNFKRLIEYFISDYHVVLVASYELLHKRRNVLNKYKHSVRGNDILSKQDVLIKYDEK